MTLLARNILVFVVYLLLQVMLFNNLTLADTATPHIFLLFLLMLPTTLSFSVMILIGFAAGLLVDVFSFNFVWGLNPFACVLMMSLRTPWIGVITNRVTFRGSEEYLLISQPVGWYVNYLFPMILLHHTAYYVLEAFGREPALQTSSKIIFSAIFTFVWCLVLTLLFYKSSRR